MKKNIIIGLIFILLFSITFYLRFQQETDIQRNNMLKIGEGKNSSKITVSAKNMKQDDLYNIFKLYLKKYNGNLYCSITSKKSDKISNIKYMLLTNTEIFKSADLTSGRFFDLSENESNKFISTNETKDVNQIGRLSDFSGNKNFEIRTIKSASIDNLFERPLILHLKDNSNIADFINDLDKQGIKVQSEALKDNSKSTSMLFPFIIASCFLIVLLIIFYGLLNSYKKIAIEKMLGFSYFSIWFKRIRTIAVIEILSIIVSSVIMIPTNIADYNPLIVSFLFNLSLLYCFIFFASIIIMSVPFIYINLISISNMLKNKRPVSEIVAFNTFVKIVLVIIFLVIAANEYRQFQVVYSRYSSAFSNWEKTKDYLIIPSIQETASSINSSQGKTEDSAKKNMDIYFYFNKNGSILADFATFSHQPTYKENLNNLKEHYKADDITINPNYLKENSVLDEAGNKVDISETENSYVILVPAKYHPFEKDIKDYYQFIKKGYDSDEDGEHSNNSTVKSSNAQQKEQSKVVNQNLKIIWTKSDQKFFSYNLKVNPDNGNCVTNPVARVVTESNGDLSDYMVIGYNDNCFKIKAFDKSNPVGSVTKKLGEYYDPTKFKFPVTPIYDYVANEIEEVKTELQFMGFTMFTLFMIILAIIFQNIINYFEQNRLRLAIQKFHGYKKIDKYKNYYLWLCITWIIVLIIPMLVNKAFDVLLIASFMIAFEFIASFILLNIIEKQKILMVTKGG